ncbi:hypothetical protein DRJ25_00830 [Candidatus Woesearchaeota archaeon]|nr:MAG: hypothetical protein DRJ25_00830 [Candidatus Woesearchaeota archaeon]
MKNNDYPKYSGEEFEIPDFLSDVVKFEMKQKGYLVKDLAEANFLGKKLYEVMGYSSPNGIKILLSNFRKGNFALGHEPLKRLAILFYFFGLDEDSEPARVLNDFALEKVYPPQFNIKYDPHSWEKKSFSEYSSVKSRIEDFIERDHPW